MERPRHFHIPILVLLLPRPRSHSRSVLCPRPPLRVPRPLLQRRSSLTPRPLPPLHRLHHLGRSAPPLELALRGSRSCNSTSIWTRMALRRLRSPGAPTLRSCLVRRLLPRTAHSGALRP